MDNNSWMGKRVRQVSCAGPEFQRHVGREGTVIDTFTDEKDTLHVQTDDHVWCPAKFMQVVAESP